jgi:hypothetical protein
MNIQRMATVILLLVGGSSPVLAQAQSGGQFCVRAFEDRNGNQQHDGGEPFLTRASPPNCWIRPVWSSGPG